MAQRVPETVFVHEGDGAWVGGAPKEASVIVTGQDFVTGGRRAAPVGTGLRPRP